MSDTERELLKAAFTSTEALRLSSLPYTVANYWDTTGFITPSVRRSTGIGSDKLYSFEDVLCLRAAREIRQMTAATRGSAHLYTVPVNFLREHGWPEARWLVWTRSVTRFADSAEELEEAWRGEVTAFTLDLTRIREGVTRDIESYGKTYPGG